MNASLLSLSDYRWVRSFKNSGLRFYLLSESVLRGCQWRFGLRKQSDRNLQFFGRWLQILVGGD